MGLMGCSETSVNYQHTLLNIPEKWRPQTYRERSLKSRNVTNCLLQNNKIFIPFHLQCTMNNIQSKYKHKFLHAFLIATFDMGKRSASRYVSIQNSCAKAEHNYRTENISTHKYKKKLKVTETL
jgi:hypothetical protein